MAYEHYCVAEAFGGTESYIIDWGDFTDTNSPSERYVRCPYRSTYPWYGSIHILPVQVVVTDGSGASVRLKTTIKCKW